MSTVIIARDTFYRALRAAALFICEDETRFHLNGVCFEITPEALNLIATDGHTLGHVQPIAKSRATGTQGAIMRAEDVEALLKVLKPAKGTGGHEVTLTLGDKRTITVSGQDISFTRTGVDSQFPPWRQFVPEKGNGNKAAGLFGVNPFYLARAGKMAEYITVDKRAGRGLEFSTPRDALDPMRMDFSDPDCASVTAVVMPMRL
jgi:hypothetical protein